MTEITAKRPRTKPAEVRREELMDAAQALFLEKGFSAASVDEIVKIADVAKGTFYLHFKTKDDVLLALQARFIDDFHNSLKDALKRCPPDAWDRRFDAWIEAAMRGYFDQVPLHDLVFHESQPVHQRIQHDNPIILQLAALLEEGAQQGAWIVKDPRRTAMMLFYALHGAVDDAVDSGSKINHKALGATVLAFCRQAIGLKPRKG
ncbi:MULTISPECIES: TetR/AcrR family transcriptional regulator [unclassified Beijerinckia]|uniref:TetR/AcrR family transcriptional regulator n=1 Tax=unclassified Beijerinckia TaxID=2638183 RepID=UPI0008948C42|nr:MULTISPECIES: TetR/AcrR family transcriptional regulator [unclassified Beijerinckia]MDH7794929.1 AcrR family transcriptional regulator [Beijerinckia sp. GAS462]SEB80782.1 transcriptional regulator, TetR family [Beijerinckia sp. 28-YEA-48]